MRPADLQRTQAMRLNLTILHRLMQQTTQLLVQRTTAGDDVHARRSDVATGDEAIRNQAFLLGGEHQLWSKASTVSYLR